MSYTLNTIIFRKRVKNMDHPQYCLTTIKTNYSQFSKTEKLVADYILQNPNKILHQTISQVADDLKVANSTVFRFCRTLGFKGYQAMKIALATEIAQPVMEMVEDKITEYDTEQQITEKIFNTNIRTFKDTIQMMDFSMLKKAVDAILKAGRVEFYGSGSSAIVALDAHHKFLGSGITTAAYTETYLQTRAASQLSNKDVAIFLSDARTNNEMVQIMEMAKHSGALTIGIATSSKSPIAKKADIVLFTATGGMELPSESDTFSRVIQLSLIDSLYLNVINAREGFLKNSIKKLKSYLGK